MPDPQPSSLITLSSSTYISARTALSLTLELKKYINLVPSLGFYSCSLYSDTPSSNLGYFLQLQFKYQLLREVFSNKIGYWNPSLYLGNVLAH